MPQPPKYQCILIDPPWEQELTGAFHREDRPENRSLSLPYKTMTINEIANLPIGRWAHDQGSHLWLWTTNQFLHEGFHLIDLWGFKYLVPIQWVKPSGAGIWWVHRTQTLLFAYRPPLKMNLRLHPNVIFSSVNPGEHSRKPEYSYTMIEAVSDGPRLELFARRKRNGWTCLGDEIDGTDLTKIRR